MRIGVDLFIDCPSDCKAGFVWYVEALSGFK